ncbi:hypothetical protein VKT23_008397 [Stygiomarasmius scandens]|uniref:DUF6593 domain-containing protein n=1 Tax=Marasmiellus scandens TaxID=2682957 RepID=A0ABR1JKB1_9AGAR
MKLYQKPTPNPTLNDGYYDESGRTVYKLHTPLRASNRTTTITKFLLPGSGQSSVSRRPTSPPGHFKLDDSEPSDIRSDGTEQSSSAEAESATSLEGNESFPSLFIYVAQIDWKAVKSNVIRFVDGRELEAAKFLRKGKWGERFFTASDGVEYKWIMGHTTSELLTNTSSDESTPIAKFHRKAGLFGSKSTPAYIEIYPAGHHIADEIFLTSIYIERNRSFS